MQSTAQRIESRKAQDRGDLWDVSGVTVPSENLRELREVTGAAQGLLSWEELPPFDEAADFKSARELLSAIAAITNDALRGDPVAGEQLTNSDSLAELFMKAKTAGDHLHEAELAKRTQAFNMVRDALASLQGAASVAQLVDRAPAAICRLGFDRAILSRLDERFWITENFYFDDDSQWAEEVREIGRENPQQLNPGIVEFESVRRKAPLVVTNVLHGDHVHRQIAESTLSRSYVVAPIMPEGHVVGFLHGDRYFQRRNVDQFDLEMLAMFAEGFASVLQRASLLDRLRSLTAAVDSLAHGISSLVEPPSVPELGTSGFGKERSEGVSGGAVRDVREPAEREPLLTRRELDVLKLMAQGETNAGVAGRLFISEGTVKSHVKHILRKLGAANRAEAVSRWFTLEEGGVRRRGAATTFTERSVTPTLSTTA